MRLENKDHQNILLVDDFPDNLKVLRTILIKQNYQVRIAINGKLALKSVMKFPPDLILLDIKMPDIDGFEVCKKIKSNPKTSDIPIIFLSASDSPKDKIKAFSSGGVDYISKPFYEDEVIARVKTHMNLRIMQKNMEHLTALLKISEADRSSGRKSDYKYRELVQNANSIIIRATPEWNITFFNEFAQKFFGYSEQEILGKNVVGTIVPESDLAGYDLVQMIQDILKHPEKYRYNENENICKNNKRVWVAWTNKIITDKNGNISEILCIGSDISKRKKTEEKLKQAKKEAEAANTAKSQFLANMSHEIRTPMNAIIGMSYLILQSKLSSKQQDYMKKIHSSAHYLLGIINDILDFSKIEAGKLVMEELVFKLDDIMSNIADITGIKAAAKGIKFSFDIDRNVPECLIGDPLRLGQILTNLINNAVKFTDSGEIIVRIQLESKQDNRVYLNFTIKDTGIGMSKEQTKGLFMPFTQADGSTTRKYGGSGLGLSICKYLVEMMGGKITVFSIPGQGSIFSFNASFAYKTEQSHSSFSNRVQESDADNKYLIQKIKGVKVLVVEDNFINRQVVKDFLENTGLTVNIANNGKQALEAVKNENFDLVLMDIQMPEMDGYEATREIRRLCSSIPIIAITAHAMAGEKDKCLRAGMNDYLIKPIDFNTLLSKLIQWIQPWQRDVCQKKPKLSDNTLSLSDKHLPINIIDTVDTIDISTLKPGFIKLAGLLKEDDMDAADLLDVLKQQLKGSINAEKKLNKIEEHISQYDFGAALEILKSLAEEFNILM